MIAPHVPPPTLSDSELHPWVEEGEAPRHTHPMLEIGPTAVL